MQTSGFLGIDVSKGYADFILLDPQQQVLEEGFQLHDNCEGRAQLRVLITAWFEKGLQHLYCGVESTGGYENNWYRLLKTLAQAKSNVHVARLNARAVKAVGDAVLRQTITDAVSAATIAQYLIRFADKVDYGTRCAATNPEAFQDARQHRNLISLQQKQKVQISNQLEKLLYQNFSELLVYCRHGVPTWLLRMLVKYSSAATVVKAGAAKLSLLKGISAQKAAALVQKATKSNHATSAQLCHVISTTAKEILHKEQVIEQEKAYLRGLLQKNEAVQLLSSIVGVGVDSAIVMAVEIEEVSRFENAKKLCAYFGLNPKFKQSGDGTWGSHMSKQGRSEVRAVLYMVALSAIRFQPALKQLYKRRRAAGMKHYQVMGIIMHKLLRIMYGVLKNKTLFDAATDEKNQQQAAEKQKQNSEKAKENSKTVKQKKHRFQAIENTDAPISRRMEQKRKKEQTAS